MYTIDPYGITSGSTAIVLPSVALVSVAVYPYSGSIVYINSHRYVAEDCGGAIQDKRIDIFFGSHEKAEQFGRQQLEVWLWVEEDNNG